MEIWIRNDCEDPAIEEEKLRRLAQRLLSALDCENAELSIWLCRDDAIRELNRQYLGKDAPTNVMSFSQREGAFGDLAPEVLGDVAISVETARRDAEEAGASPEGEVAHLLIHGVLHLLGYNHEGSEAHRAPEMEEKEAELFRLFRDEA